MHGIIFSEMKKYVDAKFGGSTWPALLKDAGLGSKLYMAIQAYPDQEAVAIVGAASKATGQPPASILEDFGEFIVPDLVGLYAAMVKPDWKLLDFLEHTETVIHAAVRARTADAAPPKLKCERISPTEIVITYTSQRKMCSVAKGIVRGAAKHYGERVLITETQCMHKGDSKCEIKVRAAG